MKTKHSQGKRDKVITLEMKLSWFELQDLVRRANTLKSNNPTWEQFVQLLEAASEMSDEPS